MLNDTREEISEKEIDHIQYDELGNPFIYNPNTGFWEFAYQGESNPKRITDFAH